MPIDRPETSLEIIIIIFGSHLFSPQRSAFARTKEEFGGIDIVCNNAGMLNEEQWRLLVDLLLVLWQLYYYDIIIIDCVFYNFTVCSN